MNNRYTHAGLQCAALLALVIGGTQAGAQQIGTYNGTTADGHALSLDVAQDPSTGDLYIDSIGSGYTMTCAKTGDQQEWGVGWQGYVAAITNGKSSAKLLGLTADTNFTATFSGTSTVKGKISAGVPELTSDKASQVCSEASQAYTATFGAAAVRLPSGSHQVVLRLDRAGHVVSRTERVMP